MIDQENYPLISIILPTFNRAHLLPETINSIVAQSYSNWECLIIDDGSIDNTPQILQPFLQLDKRLKLFDRTGNYKKGPSGCRNYGLDLAKGSYVIFFDSDDIVHPENLKTCLEVLSSGDYMFCRYDKSPFVGKWNQKKSFLKNNFQISDFSELDIAEMVTMRAGFACCTVMWNNLGINNRRFDEDLSYAEEWEFYTRLLSHGLKGASINTTLYFNRKHGSSNTGEFWNENAEMRKSKVKAVLKVINTLKNKNLLSNDLIKYFIQLGFFLKEKSIIKYILTISNSNRIKRTKYLLGFKLYPFLKPIFNLKSKLSKR